MPLVQEMNGLRRNDAAMKAAAGTQHLFCIFSYYFILRIGNEHGTHLT